MAKSGDYSVRSLAEILQEHGLETEFGTRPGRRRKDDEPKADWPARPGPESRPYSRLRPPPEPSPGTTPPGTTPPRAAPAPAAPAPAAADPYAEILRQHGLESEFGTRPDRRRREEEAAADRSSRTAHPRNTPGRGVPGPSAPLPRAASPAATPAAAGAAPASPPAARDLPMYGRRSTDAPLPSSMTTGAMPASAGPSTAAIPGLRASRKPGVPGDDGEPVGGGHSGRDAGEAAAAPEPTGRESALAWARFAGELVLALAAGVGIYFAFTVLWELMPYLALVAVPLTLTGLVAGASAWRHRRGQPQPGVRLLAVLVFAGTLLAIAPAAALLAGG